MAMNFSAMRPVKALTSSGLLACLLILPQPSNAQAPTKSPQQAETQNPALAEKIHDISPNRKFAMRISYDAEMYEKMFPAEKSDAGKASAALQRGIKEQYFSATIKKIELVALPQKLVVAELPWDGSADQMSVSWSRDSKWCAFYAETPRWGLTWVYHLRGDKFVPARENAEPGVDVEGDARGTWMTPLEIEVEGDVRREWLKPIRWAKPGVLLLEQSVILRGADAGDVTYRVTTAFDEKTGKFQVISKRKVPSKE
jgi:hypothetical protein